MRKEFFENSYKQWKEKQKNWKWLERRPWYFWVFWVLYLIAAVVFFILGIIISCRNFKFNSKMFLWFGISIVIAIACCIVMSIINNKRGIRDNFADNANYLDCCKKLHDEGGFGVYINDVKHYEYILNKIRNIREALISKFSRSFKTLGTITISVYVAFVLSCIPRLIDFYFSGSYDKEKAFKIIVVIFILGIPLVLAWTYLCFDYDSQKKKIITYEEMERDIETIIEISNNLYPTHQIQFQHIMDEANTTNT